MLRLRDATLAVGLILSTASQLRAQVPLIGPGELCLMVWLGLTLGRETGRLGPPLTPALVRILAFWVVFAFSLGLGMLAGLAIEDIRDPDSMLHDGLSYLLLAVVSCLSVVEPGAGARLRQVAWLFTSFGSLYLALLLANAWGLVTIPGVEPWFWERLQGWSENPNQLALLCAALGLVSLHLAETATRPAGRIAAFACTLLPIYVGRLTGSDSFAIVLVLAGPLFVALKLRTWLTQTGDRMRFRSASAWIVVLVLPLVLASAALFGPAIAVQTEAFAGQMSKNGGKEASRESELRFELWSEAVSRGIDSGMLGLGPGAHLVSTAYKRVPPPNFEAHNTPLDLFTQGGLIAVFIFGALLATSFHRTYKANLAGLTTLLGGLVIFSTFHLIVRHPIFWFAIALCMVAQAGTGAAPTRRQGS
jgi:hypothetical protein